MTYDRRHISPQAIEAHIQAARAERARTIKSYFANRSFFSRVIDTLKNRDASDTSVGGTPVAAR